MSADSHDSRERVLSRIRVSLGGTDENEVARRLTVQHRLAAPPSHVIPARARMARPDLVAQMRTRLEGLSASVEEIADDAEIPAAIGRYLRGQNLPAVVRTGEDRMLGGLPWSREPTLERRFGPATGSDLVGLSRAVAGAAETGTLVLVSGPDNPTTINFLPETHIVVLAKADVEGSYEAVWARLRDSFGDRNLPRTVNFISGPSRTGDIEGVLVMGAHGPRRLHVILAGVL